MSDSLLSRVSRSNVLPQNSELTPLQSQVDGLVGSFTQQATDWRSLAAMMAGGMAYRFGRIGVMSTGIRGSQILSVGLGLGAEVTTFEMTNRSLTSLTGEGSQNPNLWRWSGQGGVQQGFLSSLITFGTLKGAGRLAQGENVVIQHLFQDTGMVLGHQVSGAFGVTDRPTGSLAEQFLHAEATNLQLGAGTALGHTLTGGRLQALERGLDLSVQSTEFNLLRPTPLIQSPAFAMAEGRDFGDTVHEFPRDREEKMSVFAMVSRDDGTSGTPEEGLAKRILREVIERGQPHDIEGLRGILLKILKQPSQHLSSSDSGDWNLGLRSILHLARCHPNLEESSEFQEFAEDWSSRPHYLLPLEIKIRFDSKLKASALVQNSLRPLQHEMVKTPSLRGFLKFLLENQVAVRSEPNLYRSPPKRQGASMILLRRLSNQDGSTDFIGNWKHAGITVSFDSQGYLKLPIRVRAPYPLDQIPTSVPQIFDPPPSGPSQKDVSPDPPAPQVPTPPATPVPDSRQKRRPERSHSPIKNISDDLLAPQDGESLTFWGIRLLEILQKGERTPFQVVRYLHSLSLKEQWRKPVRELMERFSSLTRETKEGEGIVVRLYPVPRLEKPLILLGLPGLSLPDEETQVYGREIAKGLPEGARKVHEVLELDAGSGYVSFIFSKLGYARRILAVDPSPHALIVGGLNAAVNEVSNVEFREGRFLSDLPGVYRADLILASDRSALQAGQTYLRPDGRLGLKTAQKNTP